MKALFAVVILTWFAATSGPAESIEAQYSGKADVPDVGRIVFPTGKWFLEMSRVQTDPALGKQFREYFVFKRADAENERLTVLRYNPLIVPENLAELRHFQDHFLRGNGLPDETAKPDTEQGDVRLLSEVKHSEEDIALSIMTSYPKSRELWLCHVRFFRRDGWGFVMAHAATTLIDPGTVCRVMLPSRFLTELPKGLSVIPKWLVGDWIPMIEKSGQTFIIRLTANGKGAVASGGMEMWIGPVSETYDTSHHTLTVGQEHFAVDEKALTMAPVGNKGKPRNGVDQKMKKLEKPSPVFPEERDKFFWPIPGNNGIGGKQED